MQTPTKCRKAVASYQQQAHGCCQGRPEHPYPARMVCPTARSRKACLQDAGGRVCPPTAAQQLQHRPRQQPAGRNRCLRHGSRQLPLASRIFLQTKGCSCVVTRVLRA